MLGSIAESISVSSCSMQGENLLERARRLCEIEPPARRWTRNSLAAAQNTVSYRLDSATHQRIDDAIAFAKQNGLSVDNIEQEDFRLPEFAQHIFSLREQLDTGCGFVVIRNIPVNRYADDMDASEIIAWGLGNYFGRPLRQGIATDRRMFSVTDQGSTNIDPTRIGASAKRSAMHSDNGCLEPRPPCYIALMCVESAAKGGESRLITARTLFLSSIKKGLTYCRYILNNLLFVLRYYMCGPAAIRISTNPFLKSLITSFVCTMPVS